MTTKTGLMVAREACVVVVGAKPPVYRRMRVQHNKTGEWIEMNSDEIIDPGADGVPYAFKPYQKVPRNHAAVKASPSSFVPLEDLELGEEDLVVSG